MITEPCPACHQPLTILGMNPKTVHGDYAILSCGSGCPPVHRTLRCPDCHAKMQNNGISAKDPSCYIYSCTECKIAPCYLIPTGLNRLGNPKKEIIPPEEKAVGRPKLRLSETKRQERRKTQIRAAVKRNYWKKKDPPGK